VAAPEPSWQVYAWVEHAPALDAYCLTVVLGADPGGVLEAFAADPGSRRELTLAGQRSLAAPYPGGGNDTVSVDVLAGAVVCAEANGWAGQHLPRAAALSSAGPYVSWYASVNADMTVLYARDGALVRDFDPLLYDAEGALPEEAGLPFGLEHPGASAFAVAERLTGVRIERDWLLERPHPTYRRDPRADVD
jgi:hypothetical protein